jgi:hypothetical protein
LDQKQSRHLYSGQRFGLLGEIPTSGCLAGNRIERRKLEVSPSSLPYSIVTTESTLLLPHTGTCSPSSYNTMIDLLISTSGQH